MDHVDLHLHPSFFVYDTIFYMTASLYPSMWAIGKVFPALKVFYATFVVSSCCDTHQIYVTSFEFVIKLRCIRMMDVSFHTSDMWFSSSFWGVPLPDPTFLHLLRLGTGIGSVLNQPTCVSMRCCKVEVAVSCGFGWSFIQEWKGPKSTLLLRSGEIGQQGCNNCCI